VKQKFKKIWTGFITRPEIVFVTLASVFGLTSVFVMPMHMTPDEPAHFAKAFRMSEGKVFPDVQKCSENGICFAANYLPRQIIEFNTRGRDSAFSNHTDFDIFSENFDREAVTSKVDFSDRELEYVLSAESYFPIAHLPQAIGIAIGRVIYPSIAVMYFAGRIMNLAFFIALMFFIIRYVKRAKWAYALIAMFPMIICHAASFSADPIAAISIFGLFAIFQNLFIQQASIKRRQVIAIALIGLAAAFIRPTNLVLLFPLAFLPKRLFKPNRIKKIPFSVQKWLIAAGVVLLVLVIAALWTALYPSAINLAPGWTSEGVDRMGQISWIISNPLGFIKAIFFTFIHYGGSGQFTVLRFIYESMGAFSWMYYMLPGAIVTMLWIAMLITTMRRDPELKTEKSEALSSILTYVISVLAVAVTMYIIYTPIGHRVVCGLQDRYFTPFFIILIPVFFWLRKYVSVDIKKETTMGIIVFSASSIALLCYIVQTIIFFA